MTNRSPMIQLVFLACLVCAIVTAAAARAETLVPAGPVSGTWTADNSPYIVQGAIVVNAGETLSMEPGATAAFEAGAWLEIKGGFSAVGKNDAPIRFTSSADTPAPGDWGGIIFRVSGAALRFCTVEYAATGIFCDGCRIDLTDSLLQHNAENGMTVYAKAVGCDFESAKPTIARCEIAYNGGYGVAYRGEGDSWKGCEGNAFGNAAGELTDCDIHHNGTGVRVYARDGYQRNGGLAYPTIAGNHIHDNASHGIDVGGSDSTGATISDNRITGNGGAGIFCESTPLGPSISYNLIAQNALQGIDADNATIAISYNEITDNGSHGVQAVLIGGLEGNNIFDNAGYALHYLGPDDLAALDNYWGAGDPAAIESRIYTEPDTGEVLLPSYQAAYDNEPPVVLSTYPSDGAAGIAPGLLIRVVFDEGLKADAIAQDALTVADGAHSVDGRVLYTDRTLWFKPFAPLQYNAQYTVVLQPGIQDAHYARNATTQSLSWTFHTPPDCGDRCPGTLIRAETVSEQTTRLAWDGEFIWAIHKDYNYNAPSAIYKMDPAGIVHHSFSSPGNYPNALAYGDGSLWCGDWEAAKIYRLDADGNVQVEFDAPGPRPSGLAFDGEYLWGADYEQKRIYKMDQEGNIAASFPTLGYAFDLAFDGRLLWFIESQRIYALAPDGTIVDSIARPEEPSGLAFDGTFLLISYETDDDVNRIGKFRVRYADETPPTVGETRPHDGAVDVGAGTIVTAILEDDVGIDPTTITADALVLTDGASAVEGAVSYVGDTIRFFPSARLAHGAVYTASLTPHIRDLAGNPLPEVHSWSFTTRTACEAPCPGEIADAFISPRGQPSGLAWDGAHLLISEGDRIYRVSPSGRIAGSFSSPADSGGGLAPDGTDIWMTDPANRTTYRLDSEGIVRNQFPLPVNFTSAGLAFDGQHLWIGVAAGGGSAYRFDASGNIVGSIPLPAPPTGIVFDGATLWIASDQADAVYQIDPSGRILDFFPSPGARPSGLAFDGANLWCGDLGEGKIHQLPLAFMPGDATGDNLLDLADAIMALKIVCGLPAEDPGERADIDDDGKIHLPEAVYSLRSIAGRKAVSAEQNRPD